MKKILYIVLAVSIAAGMTVVQALIAKSSTRNNETVFVIAAKDISSGTVIEEEHLEEIIVYTGIAASKPADMDKDILMGKQLDADVKKGTVITEAPGCQNRPV